MVGGGIPPDLDVKIRSVAADQIDIGEALRSIDPIWVLDLAHRMIAAGQDMPVTLWRPRSSGKYAIVEDADRVAAAQRFSGLSPLDAILLDAACSERRAAAIESALRGGEVSALRAQALIADLYAPHSVRCPMRIVATGLAGSRGVADRRAPISPSRSPAMPVWRRMSPK